MILSNDEQTLLEEGILLSTEKLVISKVMVDDEDDYQFSADCYVTTDEDDEDNEDDEPLELDSEDEEVLTLLYHTKIAQSAMLYWSFIKKGMKTAIGSYTTRKMGQNYS